MNFTKSKALIVLAVVSIVSMTGCAKSELQLLKDRAAKKPTSLQEQVNLAYYYRNHNQLEKALEQYDKSLKLRPNDFMALMNKGEVLYTMKRFQDALAIFEPLAKVRPNDSMVWNNIAMCNHQMGRLTEALEAYTKALQLNPRNEPALKGLDFLKQDMKAAVEQSKKDSEDKAAKDSKSADKDKPAK